MILLYPVVETADFIILLCINEILSCVCALSLSCPTLCNSMDYSPPGASVQGISQARIPSGLPFPPPGDLCNPGVKSASLAFPPLAGRFFTTSATWRVRKV